MIQNQAAALFRQDFLVIFCHPSRESLNGFLLDNFLLGCEKVGRRARVLDLHQVDFDPRLSASEYRAARLGRPNPCPEIQAIQDEILASRALVFFFPVVWFKKPALLAGFLERVFFQGFAFQLGNGWPIGLLAPRPYVLVTTCKSSRLVWSLLGAGLLEALSDRMVFGSAGLGPGRAVRFFNVHHAETGRARAWGNRCRDLARMPLKN